MKRGSLLASDSACEVFHALKRLRALSVRVNEAWFGAHRYLAGKLYSVTHAGP